MGKYIKKYETIREWSDDLENLRQPGVSWIIDTNNFIYEKWYESDVSVRFEVSGNEAVRTKITGVNNKGTGAPNAFYYGNVTVDGKKHEIKQNGIDTEMIETWYYNFSPGNHIVKYPLQSVKSKGDGLPDSSFYLCTGMSEIVLPEQIKYIGISAFSGCSGLSSIICFAPTPPTLGNNGVFLNTNDCPIYVPDDSLSVYQSEWGNITGMTLRLTALSEKNNTVGL